MLKLCKWCGVEFNAGEHRIIFCSRKCADKGRVRKPRKELTLNCKYCGKEFVTGVLNGEPMHVFCSNSCSSSVPRNTSVIEQLDKFRTKLESGCFGWTGSVDAYGYGRIGVNKKRLKAHRAAYEEAKGEIPDGMVVCHTCDNPYCTNPDHLFIGSHSDNFNDMVSKGRRVVKPFSVQKDRWSEVLELSKSGVSQSKIALLFGVSQTSISRLLRHLRRKHEG